MARETTRPCASAYNALHWTRGHSLSLAGAREPLSLSLSLRVTDSELRGHRDWQAGPGPCQCSLSLGLREA
eukprot:261179-Rhodomonas_salina.2